MKYLSTVLVFTITFLICNGLYSQNLSKSEVKQIKTELKSFKKNPLMYKLKIQKLKKETEDREEEIEDLEAKLKLNRKTIKELNDSITVLHSAVDLLVEEAEKNAVAEENVYAMDDNFSASEMVQDPPGTVYKVQVGYFRNLNLTEYFKSPKMFSLESDNSGFTYNIGSFTSYENAKMFAEDMKKLGVSDAFVTKYNNGKRVD